LKKQELKQLDTFVKSRFVELFGDPIKNPKGWEVVKLSECLERIDNGKSFTCDSNAREGVFPAILKLSAATYGDYRPYENKALLDEKQFVESVEVHRGDLLFTRKNTPDLVGMAAYVFETPEKLMMPDLIFRLVTNERMTPTFLWQLINNREFRPAIQGISGGSAKSMSNISKERLKNIEVICPPISEQKKLEGVLEQVDKSK
ncbi:MAG: restriction endonuclease subunit S, partial [Lachnospiraceae bacterium]